MATPPGYDFDDTEPVIVACPSCGAEQEDLDGFGVVHCKACGFCTHISQHAEGSGYVCDICGIKVES